jgi:hypothetical protein
MKTAIEPNETELEKLRKEALEWLERQKYPLPFIKLAVENYALTAVEPREIDPDIYVKPPKGKTTHKGTLHPVKSESHPNTEEGKDNFCKCENPIPQATLSHACQKCYKILKEYTVKCFVIVVNEGVCEITVIMPVNASVYELCRSALSEAGHHSVPKKDIYSMIFKTSLDDMVTKLKANLVLKSVNGLWRLTNA